MGEREEEGRRERAGAREGDERHRERTSHCCYMSSLASPPPARPPSPGRSPSQTGLSPSQSPTEIAKKASPSFRAAFLFKEASSNGELLSLTHSFSRSASFRNCALVFRFGVSTKSCISCSIRCDTQCFYSPSSSAPPVTTGNSVGKE